jgi:phage terminase small subunit
MKSAIDIQSLEAKLGPQRVTFWRSWAQHYDPIEAAAEAGFSGTADEVRKAAFEEFLDAEGRCYGQVVASGHIGSALPDPRKERFCWEFVHSGDASKSYQIAYANPNAKACRSYGSRLKKEEAIQKRIIEIRSAPLLHHGINSAKVAQYTAGIAFASILNYLEVTKEGKVLVKPSDTWVDPYAVNSVEISESFDPSGKPTQKIKLGLEPRMPALKMLFDYLGMGEPLDKMVAIARQRGLEPVQTSEGLLLRDPLRPQITVDEALKTLYDSGMVVEGDNNQLTIDIPRAEEE